MLPDPCTSRDIRARLNITQDWWAHNWRAVLVERHGFPQPLAGFKRPHKWNPAHVEAWIAMRHNWLDASSPPPPCPMQTGPMQQAAANGDDAAFAARARAVAAAAKTRKIAKVA
jgi:hypothetical protein